MSEPSQPIPLDNPACIAALEQMLAFHKHIEEQRRKNAAAVSVREPTTVIGNFQSAGADVHRALKTFRAAIQHVVGNERLNQKLANLLATMERDSERFQHNLEAVLLDISGEIAGFGSVQTRERGEESGGGQ
jgi:hypothetical protein